MYQVKTKGENFKQDVIEKTYEEVATFSIEDIEAHERKLEEAKKEAAAGLAYEEAKISNIETHHAFVKKFKPEQLSTLHLYHTCNMRVQELKDRISKIETQEAVYVEEKTAIYKELEYSDDNT